MCCHELLYIWVGYCDWLLKVNTLHSRFLRSPCPSPSIFIMCECHVLKMHRPSVHFNQCKQTLASCPPVEIKPKMAAAQQKSSCIYIPVGLCSSLGGCMSRFVLCGSQIFLQLRSQSWYSADWLQLSFWAVLRWGRLHGRSFTGITHSFSLVMCWEIWGLRMANKVQKAGMSQCGRKSKVKNIDKTLIALVLNNNESWQALQHQIRTDKQSSHHRGRLISLHRALVRPGQQLSVFPLL